MHVHVKEALRRIAFLFVKVMIEDLFETKVFRAEVKLALLVMSSILFCAEQVVNSLISLHQTLKVWCTIR